MSTELKELSDYIARLTTTYLDIARDGGDLVDVIADLLAPMGYVVIGSEYYADLVQRHQAEPVLEKALLFSTFISNQEILDWEMYKGEVRSALVDEAYGRWVAENRGKALEYAGCWTGSVEAQPHGYSVQIEVELDGNDPESMVLAHMHPVSLERCRELAADLKSIDQAISVLGVDEWPVIARLDEQHGTAMNDLADEMLALLASNNLIGDDNG